MCVTSWRIFWPSASKPVFSAPASVFRLLRLLAAHAELLWTKQSFEAPQQAAGHQAIPDTTGRTTDHVTASLSRVTCSSVSSCCCCSGPSRFSARQVAGYSFTALIVLWVRHGANHRRRHGGWGCHFRMRCARCSLPLLLAESYNHLSLLPCTRPPPAFFFFLLYLCPRTYPPFPE